MLRKPPLPAVPADPAAQMDWSAYNGGVDGDHYSSLSQITPANVAGLKQVWRVDVGSDGGLQANPLVVGGVLYGYGSTLQVYALDGTTGKQLWKFDSGIVGRQPSRGLSYWTDGKESRLFAYIMNFLYALDPATGKPIASFGEGGRLDMRKDLDSDYTQNTVVAHDSRRSLQRQLDTRLPGSGNETRAARRYSGLQRAHRQASGGASTPSRTPANQGTRRGPMANGRPPEQPTTGRAWRSMRSAASCSFQPDLRFPTFTASIARVTIFTPTACSRSMPRPGSWSGTSKVCITIYGTAIFPSPPALVTVMHDGKRVDAVAQATKQGFVFVFDRVTGKPLFPIEERPFPASTVPGEMTSKTQPIPLAPAPYARQLLTADMLTTRTPEAHRWAVEQFKSFRSDGLFIPFSVDKQTIIFPGFDGGAEWGGPAIDPRIRRHLYQRQRPCVDRRTDRKPW